jgi:hypothetical protein
VNDETFVLLGGDLALRWAFAPKEFDAYEVAVGRLPGGMTDDEIEADPTVARALERLNAAVDEALERDEEGSSHET